MHFARAPTFTKVPLVKDHVHALLYNVAKELSLEVDASWAVDHNVVFFVTEYMLHHEFTVHEAGIRQAPAVAWQQYAGMPGMMAQAHIAAANAARSAAGPPPAPPAQPAPQKREADPASQPAKARRTTSEEEFEQQVNSAPTEKVAELLADASCKDREDSCGVVLLLLLQCADSPTRSPSHVAWRPWSEACSRKLSRHREGQRRTSS